jgi:hypothetical protein
MLNFAKNWNMKKIYYLIFSVLLVKSAVGQIALTNMANTHNENFDGMLAVATASLPANWKMSVAGASAPTWAAAGNFTAVNQQSSSGAPTSGGRYNWGFTGGTNRAAGFMTSGNYASPNSLMVELVNNGTTDVTAFQISYDLFRFRQNTAAHSVQFFYSTNGSTWTAVTAGDAQAMTPGASAYNFLTPANFGRSTAASSLPFSFSATVTPNSKIYLRWNFNTTGGSSAGLGLDNVNIEATFSAAATNSITTGAISTSPFCITNTETATGTVAYASAGTYTSSTYTAKLSDETGNFTTTTNIGTATVTGTNPTGNIAITIPAGTTSGTGYKIRIDSDVPAVTGSESAAFTIFNGLNNVTAVTATPAPNQATISWTNPTNCFDEVMVVMQPTSSFMVNPMGDGSAYTSNLVYGTGGASAFETGFVVYKGNISPQVVTGLTNGTTYYVKIFARRGTNWSSGVETTVSPVEIANGLQLTTADNVVTIDFDNTVAGFNNGQFAGNNINLSNAAGTISSSAFSYEATLPATTAATFSTASGLGQLSPGATSSGNYYAGLIAAGNYGLGLQPTGSVLTPGSITIKVQNKLAVPITQLLVGYKIFEFNDGGQASAYRLYHSADNTTGSYTEVANARHNTKQAADASPSLKAHYRNANISGINIAPNGVYYVRIFSDDISGSGSRDEVIIDDISFIANPVNTKLPLSNNYQTIAANAPIQLGGNVQVLDSLALNTGIIFTGVNSIELQEATSISGGNSTSYVDGKVYKNGIADKIYPVGKAGRFMPVWIGNNAGTDAYTVEYFNTAYPTTTIDPATLTTFPTYTVSNKEYWEITAAAGTQTPDIRFYHLGGASGITNPAVARIAHFDDSDWDDQGTTAANTDIFGNYILADNIVSFSPFTLATPDNSVLNTNLLNFKVVNQNGNATINWQVSSSNQIQSFEVLESADGRNYNSLAMVNAVNGQSNYGTVDNNLVQGANYYKLKITNRAGIVSYSQVAVIFHNQKGFVVNMIPTLVQNNATVQISTTQAGKATLQVVDITGRLVKSQAVQILAGSQNVSLDFSNLAAGTYQLVVSQATGERSIVRFVKQ